MIKRYVLLPNRQIAEVTDIMEWAFWFETTDRDIAKTETELHLVSTVFLGLDHNFSGVGPPLLFETMIFARGGGEVDFGDDGGCWRYSSWDDAETGHKTAVRRMLKQEAEAAKHHV